MTERNVKEAHCDQKHQAIETQYTEMKSDLEALRGDMKRVIIGVCGDVEGTKPGILKRISAIELRLTILIAILSSSVVISGAVLLFKKLIAK